MDRVTLSLRNHNVIRSYVTYLPPYVEIVHVLRDTTV